MEMTQGGNPVSDAQRILIAASRHDHDTLRTLLRNGSANVQDPETGYTPLHSAIAACKQSLMQPMKNYGALGLQVIKSEQIDGQADSEQAQLNEVEAASKTIRFLLQNGAIWNDLDRNNETPGCLALRLGLTALYDIMVNAGVRAEMLLNRLDDYEMLQDEYEDEDEDKNEGNKLGVADGGTTQDEPLGEKLDPVTVPTGVTPAQALSDASGRDITSEAYLQADLTFCSDRLLDNDKNGVMMAWESEIMQRTAELLAPRDGLRILNIGHGMGIIDEFFQTKSPSSHHIIEAHPDAIKRMKTGGWHEKSKVHEGKWQDIVPKLIEEATLFDVVYFDTFAEDYKALREFFSDYVIGLLDDGGKWGFFNGLGADRQICYDVYIKVIEMDLFEAGYDVDWVTLRIPDLEKEWKGVKIRYFALNEYKLPVCTFLG